MTIKFCDILQSKVVEEKENTEFQIKYFSFKGISLNSQNLIIFICAENNSKKFALGYENKKKRKKLMEC